VVIFIFGLVNLVYAADKGTGQNDFFFVQLSDTHWGFSNPEINPDAVGILKKTIATINSMKPQPDFVVFTGDLTHTTDDPKERTKRMTEFRDIINGLNVKDVWFLPGEHDAALDNGAAFKETFGKTYYSFDHKGVHFIAIDNVSDPAANIGDTQLQWLSDDLKKLDKNSRIVVFTHRPLFDLYPQWEWWTKDGAKAIELLTPFKNVAVFYGHIHQVNDHMTGNIEHYAAKGTMYPLPAPGSVAKKAPIPWDSAEPYKGLGFRKVEIKAKTAEYLLTEYTIDQMEKVMSITAKKFEYIPNEIKIKKGVPVILELTSLDQAHGFNCPDLGVRADVNPGKISRVQIVPQKTGTFEFHCDIFCGEGHENMTGKIIVEE
jgi:Icc-related predicted phosphoesterase